MTDQELIKALRYCVSDGNSCDGCPFNGDHKCTVHSTIYAADRLEALLAENAELNIQIQKEIVKRVDVEAENERLKAQVPKWVSVEERMPVLTKRDIREIEKFGIEGAPEFIVQIIGADRSTVLMFDGEKWVDNNGNWYSIARWMAIPELPSTEGVE